MTAPTHRQYAVTFAFLANMLLYREGITEINYYLSIPILLMTSKAGALFPDVDHNWENVKEKTFINKIINIFIHITGGKHRSWQTHSIDIVTIYTVLAYYIPIKLLEKQLISVINKEVLSILLVGFASGWISHIFSDMLTHAGVRLFCFSKRKLAFVPKKIGKLRFNTGNEWEAFCYKSTKAFNYIIAMICLIYPLILNGYIPDIIKLFIN